MKYVYCLFALLFGHVLGHAADRGALGGVVRQASGDPLAGAVVRLVGTSRGAITQSNGRFLVKDVEPGLVQVRVTFVGYDTVQKAVQVRANDTADVSIVLIEDTRNRGDIIVTATRRQEQTDTRTSVISITPKEAKYKAGAVEDVFRALQGLPGVTAPNDFSSQLVIRGSGPDQNLILMDGIELFNPYRLYGFISLFNPETVSQINLITGAFPAPYGDRLSAVLDVNNRDGSRDSGYFAGKLNVSITNANLITEGKLPFLQGSYILSTRRTYYDLIAGPIARASGAVDGDVALPNFGDIQARLTFFPATNHKVYVNGLFSSDNTQFESSANRTQADSLSLVDRSFNSVAGLTWLFTPSETFSSRAVFSWYENRGANSFGGQGGSQRIAGEEVTREEFRRIQDSLRREGIDVPTLYRINGNTNFRFAKWTARLDQVWSPSPDHRLEFGTMIDDITTGVGFEVDIDPRLRAVQQSNPRAISFPEEFEANISYLRLGTYFQDNIRLTNRLTVQPGIRHDYYEYINRHYFSPRLAASFAVDEITTIRASSGVYYQSPGYEKLFDRSVFLDFTDPSTRNLRAERSIHGVLGFERMLTDEWQFRAEAYYKWFDDLILQQVVPGTVYRVDRVPGQPATSEQGWTTPIATIGDSLTALPVNVATGESYGIEFLVQKVAIVGENTFYGIASYALSWSNRYRDGLIIPFNFDRRHALNLSGGYRLGSNWDLSVTWTYGSGFPWTDAVGITPRIVRREDPQTGELRPEIERNFKGIELVADRGGLDNLNRGRLPDYHRLDVRVTTYPQWFGLTWSVYLDVINVYNRRNIISRNWRVDDETGEIGFRETAMLPILPTFGFSLAW
jgi:hypothetical protein